MTELTEVIIQFKFKQVNSFIFLDKEEVYTFIKVSVELFRGVQKLIIMFFFFFTNIDFIFLSL